jgi:hypothetical protein
MHIKIIEIIVDRVTRSVSRNVVDGLAPVVTVAVDNALRRHSRDNARREAALLVVNADAFCEMMSKRLGAAGYSEAVGFTLSMADVVLFRKLQQAIAGYKERVRNGEN